MNASTALESGNRTEESLERFQQMRGHSRRICELLEPEDCVIQSMPDVSPTRWHLAHTTWFFETFVLKRFTQYQTSHEQFEYLFNSYYNAVGDQFPRHQRGLLSRPTVAEVIEYRRCIDAAIDRLLRDNDNPPTELLSTIEIGLNHEQQHQELMLTDIKHVFSQNPLYPALTRGNFGQQATRQRSDWVSFDEGLYEIGFQGNGFAFDNETPRHRIFQDPFQLNTSTVTNGEYISFIENGGYQRPEFWLSMGWAHVGQQALTAPLYWEYRDGGWYHYTLAGLVKVDDALPVCHLSYFEADAYARWSGARLPTEAEWEIAASDQVVSGHFADLLLEAGQAIHPTSEVAVTGPLENLFGNVWEWTSSSYSAYPGYRPLDGALGEYNGKFMCNQYVLRGGSCATPSGHIRPTYRNFFPPDARWQFSGVRLARDLND